MALTSLIASCDEPGCCGARGASILQASFAWRRLWLCGRVSFSGLVISSCELVFSWPCSSLALRVLLPQNAFARKLVVRKIAARIRVYIMKEPPYEIQQSRNGI